MTKDFKYILMFGITVIALAYLLFYTPLSNHIFGQTYKKYEEVSIASFSAPQKGKSISTTEAINIISTTEALTKKQYQKISLRDPFNVDFGYEIIVLSPEAPSNEKKIAPKKKFVLQGIFNLSEEEIIVIIDDKMLSIGDKIYGWVVTDIGIDYVILKKGLKSKILRLQLGVE